jgi:flagellar protein FlgJ
MDAMTINPSNGKNPAATSGHKMMGLWQNRLIDGMPADEAQRLAGACADFEAIFIQQLFKTMRASVPESGLLDGGRAEEIYTAMMDQEVAEEMAHGGHGAIGLADQMRGRLMHYMATGSLPDLE